MYRKVPHCNMSKKKKKKKKFQRKPSYMENTSSPKDQIMPFVKSTEVCGR